jgi:DNA-binding MarR family transcriptional regulator
VPRRAPAPSFTAAELRRLVQTFIREFGLLEQNQTPCGKPLPVSHAHALMVLLGWDPERGAMAQKDLARELGIDKSNVARLCQRMEDAGHVEQVRSPNDGRARFLRLTKRGVEVAREVDASSRERFSSLLRAMPRDQHRTVESGLKLLSAAVTASKPPRR